MIKYDLIHHLTFGHLFWYFLVIYFVYGISFLCFMTPFFSCCLVWEGISRWLFTWVWDVWSESKHLNYFSSRSCFWQFVVNGCSNIWWQELPEDKWFCCDDCHKIFEALRSSASGEPKLVPAAVSSALYKKHAKIGLNGMYMNEIQWCILSGKSRAPGHLMLLSRAAAIFRVSFPI